MRSQLKDHGFKTQSELLILSRYSCLSLGAEPPASQSLDFVFSDIMLYFLSIVQRKGPEENHGEDTESPLILQTVFWKVVNESKTLLGQ